MLVNGNFSNTPWRDIVIAEINLIIQEPKGWQLSWLRPGEPLYDDEHNMARGVPECVHKLSTQLPPNEQLGAPNALILAGDKTYKMFSATAPFGASLAQTVTGLKPGTQAVLTVPVQVHLHGETDPFGAESGVWVNGVGGWVNGFDMGDRRWHKHRVEFTVPQDGQAEIVVRVKSKWSKPKDFFVDGVTLQAETAVAPPPPDDEDEDHSSDTGTIQTVFVQLPPGVTLKETAGSQANVIEVKVGPGVKIEVV